MVISRRRALAGVFAGGLCGSACTPPEDGSVAREAEVYVALARRRELAVLDAVSDEVRARIPLAPLGERVVP